MMSAEIAFQPVRNPALEDPVEMLGRLRLQGQSIRSGRPQEWTEGTLQPCEALRNGFPCGDHRTRRRQGHSPGKRPFSW